jgi:uncharacterized protein (DUF697 family)/ethanolamine utilization protein EutP (predicted NTPase)
MISPPSGQSLERTDMNRKKSTSCDCRIYVAGQYASGKTTLIETLNGHRKDDQVIEFTAIDKGISSTDDIHCLWYCIDGSTGIELGDIGFVRNANKNTLVVITKSELMNREQKQMLTEMLGEYIDPDRIVVVSAEEKIGLDKLLDKTYGICIKMVADPVEFEKYWINNFQPLKEEYRRNSSIDADGYINWAAGRAAAIALTPLPLADAAPLIINDVYMIHKLASLYGIAADKKTVSMIMGCSGGTIAGKLAATLIPGLKVPIAAGITYGIGKAAKAYFESGMTITSDDLKRKYLDGEREAKKIDWKRQ